jgi:hypothetical protein
MESERDYIVNTVYRWLWTADSLHNVPSPFGGGLGWGEAGETESPHPGPLPEGEGTNYSPPEERQRWFSISGLGEEEREWKMFCPYCGRQFAGKELDFQHRELPIHCAECQQTFHLSEISRYIAEPLPYLDEASRYSLPEVPGLHAEQSGETLTVEYAPPPPIWGKLLGYFAPAIFLVVFFGSMFAVLLYLIASNPNSIQRCAALMAAMLLVHSPLLFHIWYSILAYYDQYRCFYASWSIQIDRYRFVVHRQYKGDSDMVTYDQRQIRKLCRNESTDRFASPLLGRFPSLLGNSGCSGLELVLFDGTVELLPHLPLRHQNRSDQGANCRWVNYLNRWLVER